MRSYDKAMIDDHPSLGGILRRIRERNGWTLKQMSGSTGIPVSTLSKVERGELTLTYDKLQQLSRRLNMSLSELFAETETPLDRPVTARRSVGRIDQAVRVETPNYDYHYLCTELRHKRIIPMIARIRTKSIKDFGTLLRHRGEEFVYVIEGEVEVHTEFYDPILLKKGESIYVDSTMGHAYVAAGGCEEALILGICTGEEDPLAEGSNRHPQAI